MLSTCPTDISWRVSSWSKNGNCVEIASSDVTVLIRDTKNRSGRVLSFPIIAWENFIKTVQADNSGLRRGLRPE
jgi:uncharacterized protein DUF397